MNKKQSLRFLLGYTAITFNALGLVMTGILSPNPFSWWLVSPLIIFTGIIDVQMLVSWMDDIR
jgi:dolichyl-phosphate-mannose--protein O-mannosyl transferase